MTDLKRVKSFTLKLTFCIFIQNISLIHQLRNCEKNKGKGGLNEKFNRITLGNKIIATKNFIKMLSIFKCFYLGLYLTYRHEFFFDFFDIFFSLNP
ncbi:hypothetical protein ACDT20_13880, partial [Staphylococcus aureus]